MSIIVIWLASAAISFGIARSKGKNEWIVLGIGLLFGFFAVIGYMLAKGSKSYQLKQTEEKLKDLKK